MGNEGDENVLHIVMFPYFAYGHILPFVHLSNKLSSHGVRISFLTSSATVDRLETMLDTSPITQIVPLTFPAVDGLPTCVENTADATPDTAELLKTALDLMQPQVESLLLQLKPHFILFDFCQHWIPSLGSKLGIKTVYYSIFFSIFTSYITIPPWLSHHPAQPLPTADDLKKPQPGMPLTPSLTSIKTFEAQNFTYAFMNFGGPSAYDRIHTAINECSAVLFRSCTDMEQPYIDYVKRNFDKPVLLAGTLVPEPLSGALEEKWDKWLGKFEAKSVVYCSFGPETFLTDDQIKEVALGLELTGFPFILVLNFPINLDGVTELKRALPEGFVDRVKDRGIVHTGWVQQQHILAHTSIGCYLFHGGFLSVIEGFVHDCQLVMLPLKADQFFNSKLVALDLKAGVEVNRRDDDGFFAKEDVCEAVREVMVDVDGEPTGAIRENHRKLREFLKNNEVQSKFITDLIEEMKDLKDLKNETKF